MHWIKLLNIEAIKFDFNKDDIGELLEDRFDIVLIRYAINFCLDIRKMLSSLKRVLNEDAIIYVSFVPPTLGTCLRWQLDDYTYLILYNPETMARLFAEEDFIAFAKYDHGSYHYLKGRHKKFFPLLIPYRIANSFKDINRELIQKNLVMIFRRNPNFSWK
jgi:ubiquinone/menaquinone biosynthesis C-methylase UbiE